MTQIHKNFIKEQVEVLFEAYQNGHITRGEIEKTLKIGKTRFFALLKRYRNHDGSFSIDYKRKSSSRLSQEIEEQIKMDLIREKELVENKELPISGYNYAALNDRLKKKGIQP